MLAGQQFRQIAALLLLGAVAADLIDAEIGMRAIGKADGGRRPADLLHGDAMGEIAKTRAAKVFLDGDAVEAERAHLRPKIGWKSVRAVDLRRARRNLGGGEGAHHVAQHVEIWAEREIETGILHRILGGPRLDASRSRSYLLKHIGWQDPSRPSSV